MTGATNPAERPLLMHLRATKVTKRRSIWASIIFSVALCAVAYVLMSPGTNHPHELDQNYVHFAAKVPRSEHVSQNVSLQPSEKSAHKAAPKSKLNDIIATRLLPVFHDVGAEALVNLPAQAEDSPPAKDKPMTLASFAGLNPAYIADALANVRNLLTDAATGLFGGTIEDYAEKVDCMNCASPMRLLICAEPREVIYITSNYIYHFAWFLSHYIGL